MNRFAEGLAIFLTLWGGVVLAIVLVVGTVVGLGDLWRAL